MKPFALSIRHAATGRRAALTVLLSALLSAAVPLTLVACSASLPPGTESSTAPSPAVASAGWRLNSQASELQFVTTKNTNVAEVQKFTRLAGSISPSGAVQLVIDLASVETQIPIRNERLQTLLFDIARFPTAQFDAQLDLAPVQALAVGTHADVDVVGTLRIRGQSHAATALLRVVSLRDNRLLVSTRAPILVNAAQYDLTAGIEQLRALMGLPNIIGTVPVSLALVFQR